MHPAGPLSPPQPPAPPAQDPGPGQEVSPLPGWAPATRPRPIRDTPAGDPAAEPGPAAPPTPPDTDPADKKLFAGKAKTFATLAEAAMQAAGGLLNGLLSSGPDDVVFLPDADDLNSVPPPAGRIIARRLKVDADANLSDAADMMTAGIGLAAWLAKGLIGLAQARHARKHPPAPPPRTIQGDVIRDDDQAGQP